MYVILTSKPGEFRTETGPGLEPIERYEYWSAERCRAQFVIAHLEGNPKVRIIDEAPPPQLNLVPSKFLPKFETLVLARAELQQLADGGEAKLLRIESPVPEPVPEKLQVTFLTNGGKVVSAAAKSNLLRVSLREQGGIPFKCGGGLCGTCHCHIESGIEHTDAVKPKERKLLSAEELSQGHRLACQTFLHGDVSVSWVPLAQRTAANRTAT